MKKTLSLILAFILCLSLCACGGDKPENTEGTYPVETTTAPAVEITPESMAGTYESILWCFHDSFTLNANTTYDYNDEITHTNNTADDATERAKHGTFTINNNRLNMEQKFDSSVSSTLPNIIVEDAFYDIKWRYFKEDTKYGLGFSPDESGMTEQTFESWVLNDDIPGSDHNYIMLELKKDGSFLMELGVKLFSFTPDENYEGTYSYADSILTLTYEGRDYPLYVNDAGEIYFVGYKKA